MSDLAGVRWRKAGHSTSTGSDCVELAKLVGAIGVRDSKNPAGGYLSLSRVELCAFVDEVKAGHHDL